MRFLVDECTGPGVAAWLRAEGHEVFSVYDLARGLDDEDILHRAHAEDWILITNDKDFGAKVYREKRPHKDIIVLRLEDERTRNKIATLRRLLAGYSTHLSDKFVVVTEKHVRFAGRA